MARVTWRLQDVLHLVGEHARQLLGAVGALQQAAEQDELATRRGHRVDDAAVDDRDPERVGLWPAFAVQRRDDAVDFRLPHGILRSARTAREVLDDRPPELLLHDTGTRAAATAATAECRRSRCRRPARWRPPARRR